MSRSTIIACFYLVIIIWIAVYSGYRGLSQYFVHAAESSKSESKISTAIEFDSKNPEAYKTRALLSLQKGNYKKAVIDYKSAVYLQPNNYLSWARLGFTYFKLDSFDNALNAYHKSEMLAPNYVQPKRSIAELLLKTGNTEQAFQYFSQAAAIDETLLPNILDIAYKTFSRDPAAIEKAVKPNSIKAKKQVAAYFLRKNMMSDATKQFLLSDEITKSEKDQFIDLLIQNKNYNLAFALWTSIEKTNNAANQSGNLLNNGGFENSIDMNEVGFGWRVNQAAGNVAVFTEDTNVFSGAKSIVLQFNGNSDPSSETLSQLSIVEADQNYRLVFAAKTQKIITGGLPVVTVVDVDTKRNISQSSAILTQDKWGKYTIDFKTTSQTKLIKISIRRLNCTSSPCPAFGNLWFDDFEMKRR